MKNDRGDRARKAILDAGLRLARQGGLAAVSSTSIAREADMSVPGVFYHFRNLDRLRDAIATQAIIGDDASVIAHLIVCGHSTVTGWTTAKRLIYLRRAAAS